MLNKCKHTWILAFIVLNISLFATVRPINFESPFNNSWYKKTLDACMHVWGDMRALVSMQKEMKPEQRTLCLDALIGRLTQADMYVMRLINGKSVVEEDDIAYLVHLLTLLNHECSKLGVEEVGVGSTINMDEQIECLFSVLKNIKKRLEAVLGPDFILSKIEQIQD